MPTDSNLGRAFNILTSQSLEDVNLLSLTESDQVRQPSNTPSTLRSDVATSRDELSRVFAADVGLTVDVPKVAFRAQINAAYESMVSEKSEFSYLLLHDTIAVTTARISNPHPKLSDAVLGDRTVADLIEALKSPDYASARSLCFRFFDEYGTHYASSVEYGGRATLYESCATTSHTGKADLKASIELEYKFVTGKISTDYKDEVEKWRSTAQRNIAVLGGSSAADELKYALFAGTADAKVWERWSVSVHDFPVMTGYHLKPVVALFDDEHGHMATALDEYAGCDILVTVDPVQIDVAVHSRPIGSHWWTSAGQIMIALIDRRSTKADLYFGTWENDKNCEEIAKKIDEFTKAHPFSAMVYAHLGWVSYAGGGFPHGPLLGRLDAAHMEVPREVTESGTFIAAANLGPSSESSVSSAFAPRGIRTSSFDVPFLPQRRGNEYVHTVIKL